ncbi:MAG: SDR family oxidoreductase [Proteobacteria bacterium]|nr:SDR family oxidoreductase [Pseudomonadota bacterium]
MSENQACADQVAVITGGSRGLGFAAARVLGRAGARVAITARKEPELDAARATLEVQGIEVFTLKNNIGQAGSAEALVEAVLGHFGQIDILVNNAGATWGEPAEKHGLDAWLRVVDVNLNGTFELTQRVAAQAMIPRGRGAIIFVASVAAFGGNQIGGVPTVAYNATKAAQVNLTKSLAAEWGPHGIRVNALVPGWFSSRMTTATLEAKGGAFLPRIPLGRFGDPELDYGGPLLFLASQASRYVTGTTLVVDGGMTCTL